MRARQKLYSGACLRYSRGARKFGTVIWRTSKKWDEMGTKKINRNVTARASRVTKLQKQEKPKQTIYSGKKGNLETPYIDLSVLRVKVPSRL